jgi:DNA repair exonuclease SbcCD ATPase subunit
MLCFAVSEACDKREEYIPRILALRVDENSNMFHVDGFNVQRILMKIISRGMVTETERISESEDQYMRNGMLLHEIEADVNLLNYNSREEDRAEKSNDERTEVRYDKMNNFTERMMKDDDIILRLEQELKLAREENEILQNASNDASKRENELSIEVESLKANYRLWTLKEEAAFLDRERLLKEKYDSDINQLKSQLDDFSKRCEEGDKAKAELAMLRDDLDVLQHLETKLLLTEDQLRKYKDKLQEFSDVRAQLSREEEAHGKAVEQILLLESELAQLQPLKRQLEVYRIRATDAEVKLAQCQHSLEKVQHLSKHLALENTELATTSKARINETEQLRQKLECPTSEDSLISSLGEGFR